jgi:hypothetical protein
VLTARAEQIAEYSLLTVRSEVCAGGAQSHLFCGRREHVRPAARAKPGQCVNSAIGSSAHAVTVSWAIICFAQFAQVGGQVGGGGQGVGVVVAKDAAAVFEGVLV